MCGSLFFRRASDWNGGLIDAESVATVPAVKLVIVVAGKTV